jgi:predicted nucleic acid-binding protein
MLRSLDLIHVSSALLVKATAIVTTDRRLRDITQMLGVKLLPQ